MRILVTGGSGFVGRFVCEDLLGRGHEVVASIRSPAAARRLPAGVSGIHVAPLGPDTEWRPALRDVQAVVHLAGLAHVLRGAPDEAYDLANTQGTVRLARQASDAGVRRFVFVSTVKGHGEGSPGRALEASDPVHPGDAYAASKARAEEALLAQHGRGGMSVAIVRPPLVYGPGVKANFRRMMEMVARGVPLPLGSVRNRRSLVSVWNLCDFVFACLSSPHAPGRAWLVSDDEDVSTPDLLRRLGVALGRPARVFPFPPSILRAVLAGIGMGPEFEKISESLFVNVEPARRELGWQPRLTLAEGLARTVAARG